MMDNSRLPADSKSVMEIAIENIRLNPNQPRRTFDNDKLDELSKSIVQNGMIEPVIVRPVGNGVYELVAGERRYRASVKAGLRKLTAICREMDDRKAFEIALVENIQREDINPVECAYAYRRLIDDFGLTQEMVADRVGKSRSSVANTLRLLNLPAEIIASLENGEITEGHARALLGTDDNINQMAIWESIRNKNLNVRETEKMIRQSILSKNSDDKNVSRETNQYKSDPNINDLEDKLKRFFGAKVSIRRNPSGSGTLAIDFYDDEDLSRILDLIAQA